MTPCKRCGRRATNGMAAGQCANVSACNRRRRRNFKESSSERAMWDAKYPRGNRPGLGPCCVCGADCHLNMHHEADRDKRRYCSTVCISIAHPFGDD